MAEVSIIEDNVNASIETTCNANLPNTVNIQNSDNPNIVAKDILCMDIFSVVSNDDQVSIETSSISNSRTNNISLNTASTEDPGIPHIVDQDNSSIDLESEKEQHELKCHIRTESLKAILAGAPTQSSWPAFMFQILGTILMSFVSTFPWSLIPAHNVVHNPEYWYEIILPNASICVINGLFFLLITGTYMNINYIKRVRHVLAILIVNIVCSLVLHPFAYYMWTYVMKYKYPVPFLGFFIVYINWLAMFLTNWFQFPLQCQKTLDLDYV